jgi:quinoprotein glucose dehydrogenase
LNRSNVQNLKIAWEFYPNDAPEGFQIWKYECNPIVVNGVMYLTSAWRWLYAVDAETGKQLWSFDPLQGKRGGGVLRGVTYWKDPDSDDERILVSARSRLFAVNAKNGQPIPEFGEGGSISLEVPQPERQEAGTVRLSTPGIIYQNLIIVGAVVSESPGAAPGPVRAFDVKNGSLVWTFNTIPKPGEFGFDTWPEDAYKTVGGANNWAGMSLDVSRGIVYIPTGSPTYDYYATDRIGSNLFANTLLALDAATGKYLWHFQTVHHDLWDYDLPTAPNLVVVERNGQKIDAVAQPTKMGFIYLLDRTTGEPLFPVEERSVPPSTIPGEQAWPTQPFPLKPQPFSRQGLSPDQLQAHNLWFKGLFTPLGLQTTVMFPGSRGGAEWGGGAYDPETGILYINSNDIPELGRLEKTKVMDEAISTLYSAGEALYKMHCASCHGSDKTGVESMPSLVNLHQRLTKSEIIEIINRGSGIMPSFAQLPEGSKNELLAFLTETGKNIAVQSQESQDTTTTFRNAINKQLFTDSLGRPLVAPPWGTLNAVDLNSGEYLWQVPLGSHPEFQKPGEPDTGMENYGGPVVTAGGLVFIAATMDRMFRAFDKETGALIWEYKLPGNGLANPSVYQINNKAYISIAVSIGENFNHTNSGIVTFSLAEP